MDKQNDIMTNMRLSQNANSYGCASIVQWPSAANLVSHDS